MTTINDSTKFSWTVLIVVVAMAIYAAKIDWQANATAADVSAIQKDRAERREKFEKLFVDVEIMKNDVHEMKKLLKDEAE